MDVEEVKGEVLAFLAETAPLFPPGVVDPFLVMTNAGEFEMALEDFCTQVSEYKLLLPRRIGVKLTALLNRLDMSVPDWLSIALKEG